MADDPKKKVPQDASRVNVNQQHELDYWTKKFACTEAELKAAVKAVGDSVSKVEQELKEQKKRKK